MQKMFKKSRAKFCIFFTMVFFFVFSFQPIYASMVTTGMVINESKIETTRSDILTHINDEDVRQQLERMGVDPNDAYERVANMTGTEIREMHASMENVPAGGSLGLILVAGVLIPAAWLFYWMFYLERDYQDRRSD